MLACETDEQRAAVLRVMPVRTRSVDFTLSGWHIAGGLTDSDAESTRYILTALTASADPGAWR